MIRILTLLFVFTASGAVAQNVGIGSTNFTPASSALLELRSTSSGLLIPRMTQAQMTSIASPTEGLLVYQSNGTKGFMYFNGADWRSFSDNLGNHIATDNVEVNGNWISNDGDNEGIRIADNGYVGIGSSSPDYPLIVSSIGVDSDIAGNNNNYLMRVEQSSTANNGGGIMIKGSRNMAQVSSFVDFGNFDSGLGSEYILGRLGGVNEDSGEQGALAFFTNQGGSGNSGLTEKMRIDSDGKVGIGTASPARSLHVVNNSSNRNVVHIQSTASDGWSSIDFLDHSGSLSATFGFANSGTSSTFSNRAYMNSYDHDFILTRNSSESSIFIEGSNGHIGLNTDNPQARLHVQGDIRVSDLAGSGTRMVVADASGNISTQQLPSAGSTPTTVESGSNRNVNSSSYNSSQAEVLEVSGISAGTYLVNFNADISRNGSSSCQCIIRAGGSDDSDTERSFQIPSSGTSQFHLMGKVTLSSTGTIEVRCRKSSGGSGMTVGKRAMSVQPTN